MTPRAGPLAVTALGTPLSRSTHNRKMTATGQLVSVRKSRVSVGTGVRKRWIVSPLSPGTSVMVGRLAPLTERVGQNRRECPKEGVAAGIGRDEKWPGLRGARQLILSGD